MDSILKYYIINKAYISNTRKKVLFVLLVLISAFYISSTNVQAEENVQDVIHMPRGACDCCLEEDNIATPIEVLNNNESSSLSINVEDIPSSVNLSTTKYFPPIRKQHGGSCGAWASTYYHFTYEVAKYMSEKNPAIDDDWNPKEDDSKIFSPKYIWNYLNGGFGGGNTATAYYNTLAEIGSLKWSQFPQENDSYEWYEGANDNETSLALMESLRIRPEYIPDYFSTILGNPSGPLITNVNDSALQELKYTLANGHCFTISSYIYSHRIARLSNGEWGCISVDGSEGSHALTIVGYDDSIWYDYNNDNIVQDYEKGAFLAANSWGTDYAYHNDGYLWIMYDALNQISNNDNLPTIEEGRMPAFWGYQYRKINIIEYNNDLMVEVTIEQTERDNIGISLGVSETLTTEKTTKQTIINGIGGALGFNGTVSSNPDTRIFIFDYSDLYNGDNLVYWLNVTDNASTNSTDTKVTRIRWLKPNGAVIKELGPQNQLSNITGFYNTVENYVNLDTNQKYSGYISPTKPIDYFKFTPRSNGNYIFYTTGNTDTLLNIYNDSWELVASNDDYEQTSHNSAIRYEFEAGKTYYIRLNSYDIEDVISTSNYSIFVTRESYIISLENSNPDARNVQIHAEVSSIFTTMYLSIGNKSYTFTKPSNGNMLELTIGSSTFKITYSSTRNGCGCLWEIQGKIPATKVGSTETIYFDFEAGSGSIVDEGTFFYNFVAFNSKIKTGIEEGTTVQTLLNSMTSTGYTLTALDYDNTPINDKETTNVATGMKIIKTKKSNNKITEVYYVLLFGDVVGTGNIGDGLISSEDSLAVLNHVVKNSTFGSLAALAADVNHDGVITAEDSYAINNHVIRYNLIEQNYSISNVPDDCYYLEPVIWL